MFVFNVSNVQHTPTTRLTVL